MIVFQPGRLHDQQSGSFYLCSHVCQFELDGLMLSDLLTESLPGLGIFQSQFIRTGCNTQCL